MTNIIQDLLIPLAKRQNLTLEESQHAFQIIMNGGATPAQMGAFLMGLRQKGETVEEITGGAIVMRSKCVAVAAPEDTIDTCGTGGDHKGSLNISTATALVVAGCGIPVAKHGNRAVTSSSGSADVLSDLGVNINADKFVAERCLAEAGICFMMAPRFHPAMRHIAPVRQELGLRSIFNFLGPVCNPAKPKRQIIGVFAPEWLMPMAEVLHNLGSEHAWIVHGSDGMDELTLTGSSSIAELKHGTIHRFEITPEDAGLARCQPEALKGGTPEQNARALMHLLEGKESAYLDVVLLNAAACLMISGKCLNLRDGIILAREAVMNGKAKQVLATLAHLSQS